MRIAHSFLRRRELGASMTPMIDVVFLLLIFFICTASFQIVEETLPAYILAQGATEIELPPEPEEDLERIIIEIGSSGEDVSLQLNSQPIATLDALSERLDQIAVGAGTSLPVIVDGANVAPTGLVIDVYDRCRLTGFERVQFAIEK